MHKFFNPAKCSKIISSLSSLVNTSIAATGNKFTMENVIPSFFIRTLGLNFQGSKKGNDVGEAFGNSVIPIKMAYSSYETTRPNAERDYPVVIMHGLLGSKSNWNSLAKAIHNKTKKKIIAVDARNHGESPHTPEMTYNHLAADVRALATDLSLPKSVMVGHSMGGRAMMMVALKFPELVKKLVVVDISPLGTSPSLRYMTKYFAAMRLIKVEQKVPLSAARKAVDSQLSTYISDPGLRQFLITNLVETEDGHYKWRVNLEAITNNFISHISNFPNAGNAKYMGPTLFIGGANSDFLKKDEEGGIKKLFPNAEFKYIPNAGHWLHSEKPQEFLDTLIPFIERDS